MIVGIGTDVVSVARIARLLTPGAGPDTFVARWFSDAEAAYCRAKAHPARHVAARLAAKESVAKALRLDADRPVPWRDIEVALDDQGAPGVRLHGALAGAAPAHARWHLSLSHCDEFATAVAVLEVDPDAADAGAAGLGGSAGDRVLGEAVSQSLREFERSRAGRATDPQLEAIHAAIMLEDVADVVLREDQIDPTVLADASAMARVVAALRADR